MQSQERSDELVSKFSRSTQRGKKVILCDQKIKTKRLSEVERRQEFLSWSHLNEIINVTKKKIQTLSETFYNKYNRTTFIELFLVMSLSIDQ